MTTTDAEKVEMTTNTNQRLVTILLVLLIILLGLLVLGIVASFLMMSGMMGWGGMTLAPGASAGVANDMANACNEIMRNVQAP